MPYTITMVSALSLQEVLLERPIGEFTDTLDKSQIMQLRKTWLGRGHSMLLVCFIFYLPNPLCELLFQIVFRETRWS